MPRHAATKAKPEIDPKPEPEQPEESPRSRYARAAVQARWAAEKASEEDLREHVRALDRQGMMAYLDKLRTACEVVAKEVNQRLCEEIPETVCETCGGAKKGQWRLIKPIRNHRLGTLENLYFCSDVCIVMYNQKTQGIAAIPDRGMSRGSAMPDVVPAAKIVERNVAAAKENATRINKQASDWNIPEGFAPQRNARSKA
jgi:hypothetical protein